jgi:hypothetical protein
MDLQNYSRQFTLYNAKSESHRTSFKKPLVLTRKSEVLSLAAQPERYAP